MIINRSQLLFVCITPLLLAAEPAQTDPTLKLQKTMTTARQFLDLNMSAEAVTALEAELANVGGNKSYLALLREAYLAEMFRIEKSDKPDTVRVTELRKHLAMLGAATPGSAKPPAPIVPAVSAKPVGSEIPEPAIEPPAAVPTPAATPLEEATIAFKKGDYAVAARFFATASNLTPAEHAAWAYCRVKLAAEKLNARDCKPGDAELAIREVTAALQEVPPGSELHKVGQALIELGRSKSGSGAGKAIASSANELETANFRIKHTGNADFAEELATAAESHRKAIFERWSGPPAGAWAVKCDIVLHATAEAYSSATGRPGEATGSSVVRLADRRATERRIDLRADHAAIKTDALPRELTHIILADLFPDKSPPKWAEQGMAILSGSAEEIDRYTRTLPRCAREGDWFTLAKLMELNEFPAEKITGFYCQSVSLTEYMIRSAGGERNFTIFLRDCQRYGTAQAIKRQYGVDGPDALEAAWKRATLATGRAQAP